MASSCHCFIFICMCVAFMRVCRSVSTSEHMRRSEDNGCLSLVPVFPWHRVSQWPWSSLFQLGWLASESLPLAVTSGFYMGAQDFNSCPHTCTASILIQQAISVALRSTLVLNKTESYTEPQDGLEANSYTSLDRWLFPFMSMKDKTSFVR